MQVWVRIPSATCLQNPTWYTVNVGGHWWIPYVSVYAYCSRTSIVLLSALSSQHSLTNEQTKKNWELYGDPDGPRGMFSPRVQFFTRRLRSCALLGVWMCVWWLYVALDKMCLLNVNKCKLSTLFYIHNLNWYVDAYVKCKYFIYIYIYIYRKHVCNHHVQPYYNLIVTLFQC